MNRKKDVRDRVIITDTTVPRTKIFSVRRLLTYNTEKYLTRGELVPDPSENMSDGLELAKRLFEIRGVQAIMISQYDIYLTIGRSFDWQFDYMESAVISMIGNYLKTFDMMEDISDKKEKKKPESEK